MVKKKILMIDDETDYTSITKVYLEEAGSYEVMVVNRGVQGYAAADIFRPDIILLDISMPDMSGLDVAKQLADNPELKNIPIIFFTGFYEPTEVDVGSQTILGHPYLKKPTSGEKLLRHIQKSLGDD